MHFPFFRRDRRIEFNPRSLCTASYDVFRTLRGPCACRYGTFISFKRVLFVARSPFDAENATELSVTRTLLRFEIRYYSSAWLLYRRRRRDDDVTRCCLRYTLATRVPLPTETAYVIGFLVRIVCVITYNLLLFAFMRNGKYFTIIFFFLAFFAVIFDFQRRRKGEAVGATVSGSA